MSTQSKTLQATIAQAEKEHSKALNWLWLFVEAQNGETLWEALERQHGDKYREVMSESERSNWDGLCQCGHRHSNHGKSLSINYTAGTCGIKACKCRNFISSPTTTAIANADGRPQ